MTPLQKLEMLAMSLIPQFRDAFLASIANIVDSVMLSEITKAIEAGDFDKAVMLLGMTEPAFRPLTRALQDAFEQLGDGKAQTFPKRIGDMIFRFNIRNERAENWLKTKSSELISQITDDARSNVRNVITAGMESGRNPRNVALDIIGRIDPATGKRVGGVIGLTKNQEHWVASTRRKLNALDSKYFELELRDKRFDATVAKAIEQSKALPQSVVDKLVDRYKANALRHRAENIARTEMIHSLNQAEYEATKQVVDSGSVSTQAVWREWDSAGDGRVRPSHKALDGQRVRLDEAFTTMDGQKLMFPGDGSLGASVNEIANCRCRVKTVVDWLDGVN